MTHIPGSDRSQLLLLPEAVDDYVAADNPVRFVDAFMDGLDLKAAGFARVEPKATAVQATRRAICSSSTFTAISTASCRAGGSSGRPQRNIELMWLTGRLTPDFKTIADSRRNNGPAIRAGLLTNGTARQTSTFINSSLWE